jgi:hypothetical protein
MTLEWPQITMALLMALNTLINFIKDGQFKDPSSQRYNFKTGLIGTAISVGLLYAGGFWG